MLWIKALHIVFMASWFAGLFYLPRIFVNLAMVPPGSLAERQRLLLMARKLYRFMTPLGAIALARGWLAAADALAGRTDAPLGEAFYRAQQHTAQVYFAYVLPQVHTFAAQVHSGGEALLAVPFEAY